jgi:uncharacterized DUF497 family protein
MSFSWDPKKAAANLAKHSISFEDACLIFNGPMSESIDDRFSYGEERIKATGILKGVEITVIYTNRPGEERRIISARQATRAERRNYWTEIGG